MFDVCHYMLKEKKEEKRRKKTEKHVDGAVFLFVSLMKRSADREIFKPPVPQLRTEIRGVTRPTSPLRIRSAIQQPNCHGESLFICQVDPHDAISKAEAPSECPAELAISFGAALRGETARPGWGAGAATLYFFFFF